MLQVLCQFSGCRRSIECPPQNPSSNVCVFVLNSEGADGLMGSVGRDQRHEVLSVGADVAMIPLLLSVAEAFFIRLGM